MKSKNFNEKFFKANPERTVSKKQILLQSMSLNKFSYLDRSIESESIIKNKGIKYHLFKNLIRSQIPKESSLLQVGHFKTEGRKI